MKGNFPDHLFTSPFFDKFMTGLLSNVPEKLFCRTVGRGSKESLREFHVNQGEHHARHLSQIFRT